VPTMKGGRHASKGGSLGVSSGLPRGHEGQKLPLSPNPCEMMRQRRRTKTRKRVEQLPLPTLHPLKTSSHLVTSSASKRGSPLVLVSRNHLDEGREIV
jgi:hypothetical protein